MLQIDPSEVQAGPFPHVVKQGILPTELYARLRADFPTENHFSDEMAKHGAKGSRVGSGFDIYRGDESYDRLIAKSAAWAEFDAYINSSDFVADFLRFFGDHLDNLGCSAVIDPAAYDRDFIEAREVLTPSKTIGERVKETLFKLGGSSDKPARLFTRLDVEKSMGGYEKKPHCDRANRLCSLIVYFTDTQSVGIKGGNLSIFKHKTRNDPRKQERHPHPEDVETVATLSPKENLGVFFPCSNNSYHGVDEVTTKGIARDFLYINISVDQPSCW